MKKVILILAAVLLVAAIGGGVWFWNAMQQPLYQPGMVRAGTNLSASLAPPPTAADGDYWTVENDIRLYHFAEGAGTNVLVVHGGPGFPFAGPVEGLKALTARYRFHYYDQRGCGKSSRPIDRTLGIGAQIADIERIRRILGDEKIILIGHSFGGFLASLYAAEFPEHVQALILVAPAEVLVMPPESGGLFAQVKPLLPEEMQKEYDAYLTRYLDYGSIFGKSESELAALNAEFTRYYSVAASRKGFALTADTGGSAGGGWMVHAMYMSMGLRHDYRAALQAVRAPVLVIHGEKDLQPEKASRMYADFLPNAEFRTIANAGHFVFDDQPQAFAEVVGQWLVGK